MKYCAIMRYCAIISSSEMDDGPKGLVPQNEISTPKCIALGGAAQKVIMRRQVMLKLVMLKLVTEGVAKTSYLFREV